MSDLPEVTFDGNDSRGRLEELQKLCSATSYGGILVVPGQDGLYNRGSQAVMKFLFVGGSASELQGQCFFPEALESMEDCILMIKPDSVDIFYNARAKKVVAPHLARWRNVTEHRVLDREMLDTDQWELRKIQSFIRMCQGTERVGVPLLPGDDSKDMDIEKWPIVQVRRRWNHHKSWHSCPTTLSLTHAHCTTRH